MLNNKLLEQFKNLNEIKQEFIISDDNASICRQLIYLFHYILCLDEYKMTKQQPLTNNFTAYKRMHSEFLNKQNYSGGGFNAFSSRDKSKSNNISEQLTSKELLPIDDLTNVCLLYIEYIYNANLRTNTLCRFQCLWVKDQLHVLI